MVLNFKVEVFKCSRCLRFDDCKKRWKNIKDTYGKKISRRIGRPPPSKKGRSWQLTEKLEFLQPVYRMSFSNVDGTENGEDIENPVKTELKVLDGIISFGQNSKEEPQSPSSSAFACFEEISSEVASNSELEAISKTPKKENDTDNFCSYTLEKRSTEREDLMKTLLPSEEIVDEIDLFFQSIGKSVKKLSVPLQHRAKMETLKILCKLEKEMSQSSFQHSSFGYNSSSCTVNSTSSVSLDEFKM